MNRILAGTLGGIAATVPMTAVMAAMFKSLPWRQRYPMPPREITSKMLREVGIEHELSEQAEVALTTVSHFGYGGAIGAVYGLVSDRLPGPPLVKGIGYGLAVWAGSYLGWLPAANILKPATDHPAERNAMMIAAHVVFGGTLALFVDRFHGGRSRRSASRARSQARPYERDSEPMPTDETDTRLPYGGGPH